MGNFEYRDEYWTAKPKWTATNTGDIILAFENIIVDEVIGSSKDRKKGNVKSSPKKSFDTVSKKILLPLLNLELLLYVTIALAGAVVILVGVQPLSWAMSLLFIYAAALLMVYISFINHKDRTNEESNELTKNSNIYFRHSGLNLRECRETVNLLNKLKAEDNKSEYQKIVKNLLHEEALYHEGKVEHEKILSGLSNKMIKNKVVTDDVHQSNKLSTRVSIFNGAVVDVTQVKKDFVNVTSTLEKLQNGRGEITVLKDCYRELTENTLKYEDIVESGGVISRGEWEAFHTLIITCENIIKRTEVQELEGSLAVPTTISSMFLKDKYNLKEEVTKNI